MNESWVILLKIGNSLLLLSGKHYLFIVLSQISLSCLPSKEFTGNNWNIIKQNNAKKSSFFSISIIINQFTLTEKFFRNLNSVCLNYFQNLVGALKNQNGVLAWLSKLSAWGCVCWKTRGSILCPTCLAAVYVSLLHVYAHLNLMKKERIRVAMS